MRSIGLHLRFNQSFGRVIDKAIKFKLPIFQSFLVQKNNTQIRYIDQDIRKFVELKRQHFDQLYVHGSYWINLANIHYDNHYCLRREIALAKKLEFSHMILHAGSAKGACHRNDGIYAMAKVFNRLLKYESNIKFILENTAYGNFTIGGDFEDFKLLLSLLNHPEKLLFCIDNAHAHSFGYDLITNEGRTVFINMLDETIGLDKIALLHINDTYHLRGSKMDKHEVIGAGVLGDKAIYEFIMTEKIAHVPIILELPEISEENELMVLEKIREWHNQKKESNV